MSPHTPGPWHVEVSEADHVSLVICKAGDGVLAVVNPEETPDETDHANAHLMALAPELLAGLKSNLEILIDLRDNRLSHCAAVTLAILQKRIENTQQLIVKAEVTPV